MVFGHFCSETTRKSGSMASPAPVKSQPLHNFSLPLWNWSKSQHSNVQTYLRTRKGAAPDSTGKPSPQTYAEPSRASICRSSSDSEIRGSPQGEAVKNGCTVSGSDVSVDNGRSKVLIKFRTKNTASGGEAVQDEERRVEEEAAQGSGPKTWNLRPRRVSSKRARSSGEAANESSASTAMQHCRPESARCGDGFDAMIVEKKEKPRKFTIPLSKEDIEEDIFALTGSKASKRPKKRVRTVQKQLDCVFPGLWLATITPDSYRVPEIPSKGRV